MLAHWNLLTLIVASDEAENKKRPEREMMSDVTDPKCPDSDWLCICVCASYTWIFLLYVPTIFNIKKHFVRFDYFSGLCNDKFGL